MDNFVRQGQQSILKSIWQVIQVVPLGTPGLFRLWVSIDGNIQQLRVREVPEVGSDLKMGLTRLCYSTGLLLLCTLFSPFERTRR